MPFRMAETESVAVVKVIGIGGGGLANNTQFVPVRDYLLVKLGEIRLGFYFLV